MPPATELHRHAIHDDASFGLDRDSDLAVVFFPEEANDFGVFQQKKEIEERLSIIGRRLMLLAKVQAHLKPGELSAGANAHVLEHGSQKLKVGKLLGRIDVLINFLG